MISEELQKEIYFPYPKIREVQSDMISDIGKSLKEKKHIIMHAPTGIGKTIACLAPTLPFAIKNNLTIFFLTSRQTQHRIVIETLKQIRQKYDLKLECTDLIGKKNMCLQQGIEALGSGSFYDFCKSLREDGKCDFYTRTRNSNGSATVDAKHSIEELKILSPCHVHEYVDFGRKKGQCPYELALLQATNSSVIVADYHYIFNEPIRDGLLLKINKQLKDIIIVIDEAHNLPSRIRELLSDKLTTHMLENAKREAKKYEFEETAKNIEIVENALFELSREIEEEGIIPKAKLVEKINKTKPYDDIFTELQFAGEDIRDKQKVSYVLGIGHFLQKWLGQDAGFGRILSKLVDKKVEMSLSYRCLDPSLATRGVFDKCHSSILMSGTLTPTSMYKDILGVTGATEKEYKSPFPKNNRLNLIIPKTTTKFTERNNKQFNEIAKVCSEISQIANGNVAIFFPSYELMLSVNEFLKGHTKNPIFLEKQKMSKIEKEHLLATFKGYKDAMLLGVSTGSFGEGVDMPGILKAVIVVGLPLQKPDTEARLLIDYYNDKFGKGMEYGYVLPAMTKCFQNAGRCIRSEKDKGAIIFLDDRYARIYYSYFPPDWDVEVEMDYLNELKEFFRG